MVGLEHNLNFEGWNSQTHRGFIGKFDPSNVSRDNVSREIGRIIMIMIMLLLMTLMLLLLCLLLLLLLIMIIIIIMIITVINGSEPVQ